MLAIVAWYLRIERLRVRDARSSAAVGRDVVLDGTFDAVVERARILGLVHGFNCNREVRRLVQPGDRLVPDVTLRLQAPPAVRRLRAGGAPRALDELTLVDGYRDCFPQPFGRTLLRLVATALLGGLADAVE